MRKRDMTKRPGPSRRGRYLCRLAGTRAVTTTSIYPPLTLPLPVYTHILASYIAYCIRLLLECCAFPSPSREHPAIDWSATYYQLPPFDCCSAYRHLTTACLLPSLHIPVHP